MLLGGLIYINTKSQFSKIVLRGVTVALIASTIFLSIEYQKQREEITGLQSTVEKRQKEVKILSIEKRDLIKNNQERNKENIELKEGLEEKESEVLELKKEISELRQRVQKPSRGISSSKKTNFVATAYCPCKICNGKWVGYPTKSGVYPKEGETIAVDPSVIPLGSKVSIDGIGGRKAQDTGSKIKGNKIDIFFNSHKKAKDFGRRRVYLEVVK